jgi:hypothetical protein
MDKNLHYSIICPVKKRVVPLSNLACTGTDKKYELIKQVTFFCGLEGHLNNW